MEFKLTRAADWEILLRQFLEGSEIFGQLTELLEEECFSVGDSGISRRLLNYWTEEGLIFDNREGDSKGWRRLSRLDLIWILVLVEIRSFGMSLDSLRISYKSIIQGSVKSKDLSYLEFGVALCLQKTQVSLIVFKDGWIELMRTQDIEINGGLNVLNDSYIVVSLNSICSRVLNGKGKASVEVPRVFSKLEKETIDLLNSGDIDGLEIVFKNKKPVALKTRVKKDKNANINHLINQIENGSVQVKRQDRKTMLVETTIAERK